MQSINEVLSDIMSDRKKKVILDTDTYNEIDDQFALAYAMRLSALPNAPLELLSVNAAPFLNSRSTSPLDGMEKSYAEIGRILKLIDPNSTLPYYKGSTRFMTDKASPESSAASQNIIDTALASDERIYVVTIGAPTNVAAALTLCPELKERIAVVWLGGHALHWHNAREFNMMQDIPSSQILLDSGVPLAIIPCGGVCDRLATTVPELEYYLRGKNELCDYLVDIVKGYTSGTVKAWSKVIWDVSAVACLALRSSMERVLLPTPILTNDCHYATDSSRHHFIYVRCLDRDQIFADLFEKL